MERQVFDLVILDLLMPGGMTGLELLMAAHTQYPRTAFLIATGVHDASVEATAMRLGAKAYLLKPFDLDAVAKSVKRALDIQREV
jgi:DNA-binding NtrC family response regulator